MPNINPKIAIVEAKLEYWNGKDWKPMWPDEIKIPMEGIVPMVGFSGCTGVTGVVGPYPKESGIALPSNPPTAEKVYEEPEPNGRRIDLGEEE